MKKVVLAAIVLCLSVFLAGCGSGTDESKEGATNSQEQPKQEEKQQPLDLSGEWKQSNPNSDDTWMEATISGDTIVVNWITPDSKSLYWAGTYVAPTEATDSYSWESVNDKEKTTPALMASGDDTKKFTYENGEISYDQTALGSTITVKMARQ